MMDSQKHEQFEMEVLKLLSDNQLLNSLTFGGGTCLRLCFGLNRYSVDLDFFRREPTGKSFFFTLRKVIESHYEVTDFWEKHFAFLIEFRSPHYPKRLKVEMRKRIVKTYKTELNIAFSPFSSTQVRLVTFTLEQMWKNKAYATTTPRPTQQKIGAILDSFKPRDFKVKLGSLIENEDRAFYNQNGFKILKNGLLQMPTPS